MAKPEWDLPKQQVFSNLFENRYSCNRIMHKFHNNFSNVNLRKFDIMSITYMLRMKLQVPVPKKIVGFQQTILPFMPQVWIFLGMDVNHTGN